MEFNIMSEELFVKFSKEFLSKYKNKQVPWGFGNLSYITYKRTYARKISGDEIKEEWWETIKRGIEGAQEIGAKYTVSEAERLYDLMFNLKGSFAGRPLWQLGTDIVRKFGGNSLLNCFAGETKVLIRQGWKEIKDLAGTEQEIVTENGKWVKAPFYNFGKQKLYKIEYDYYGETKSFFATKNHNWIIIDDNEERITVKTIDLKKGMNLACVYPEHPEDIEYANPLRPPDSLIEKHDSLYISNDPYETDREEDVYCAVVPETHSFVIDGNCLTGNCWFTTIDSIESFLFLFDNLMLGGGVGFSVRREHVHELPKVKKNVKIIHEETNDADFIVPDSRKGWSELLRKVFESYFITGKSFSYSTILVRGQGEVIKTFGGVASGPLPLIESISDISKIFNARAGKKIRSIDALDICNLLGRIVVSGNVRRCIREGSKVKTFNGEKNIEDIKVGDAVLTEGGWKKVKNFFSQGKQKCVRIKCGNKSLDCTSNHRIAIYHENGFEKKYNNTYDGENGFNTGLMYDYKSGPFITYYSADIIKRLVENGLNFNLVTVSDFDDDEKYYPSTGDKLPSYVIPISMDSYEELDKKYETYDIEVEDNHSFICNGLLVHNSAEIAIGDIDDVSFLKAKRWDLGQLPAWRAYSNNSIYCDNIDDLLPAFWEGYNGNGESYGLINLENCKKYGRIGEKKVDENVEGMNPCFAYETEIVTSTKITSIGNWAENGNVEEVWDGYNWIEAKAFYTGERKLITLKLSDDNELRLTPDHIIYTYDDTPIMAKDSLGIFLKKMIPGESLNEYNEDGVKVVGIDECGIESVYDFSMDQTHTACVSGIKVHNCGEIPLADNECCNLQELFLNNITSKEELIECAILLYKTSKAICNLPFLHEETNKIVHKNMKIGIGITGVCQSLDKLGWLDEAYRKLKEFDVEWSKKNNYPESIRLTTVKPSGTVSLLAGSTPGVHPGFSRYHIRRVRFATNNPLVDVCRKAGYEVEYSIGFDGKMDYTTSIVSFPCEFKGNVITVDEMTILEQMDLVKEVQRIWSDNAVSCTVYYDRNEVDVIKNWLSKNYKDNIKSISFCLKNDSGFKQMPLQAITKEKYDRMSKSIKDIDLRQDKNDDEVDVGSCSTGACPIK